MSEKRSSACAVRVTQGRVERADQPSAAWYAEIAGRRIGPGRCSPVGRIDIPMGLVRRFSIEAVKRHRLTKTVIIDAARDSQATAVVNRFERDGEVMSSISGRRHHQLISMQRGAGIDCPTSVSLLRADLAVSLEGEPRSARRSHRDGVLIAIDGNRLRCIQPVHEALIGTLPLVGRQRAHRLFSRLTRIVAPAALELVRSHKAMIEPRASLVARVTGIAPIPGHVLRVRQVVEITTH